MSSEDTAPGDEAAPGTPGTGENICRHCKGTGEHEGRACPVCDGSGKVIEGLAGG
jgi:DnaJ-class molecular chaperone